MNYFPPPSARPELPTFTVGGRTLRFGGRAYLMGVINVTPDSFSDGGQFLDHQKAIAQGRALVEAGASIIDIGGESTRPGADPVTADEEIERVIPVIRGLRRESDAWISIDTYKASVAEAALDAGADIVNDISGLGFDEEMAPLVARRECGLVIMHIKKTPKTMQEEIHYGDLLGEVRAFFEERVARARAAGIKGSRIILDPGIGFGKTVEHNLELLRELSKFIELGHPLLVGTSRKSFLGAVTGKPVEQRLMATAASVACAVLTGADILRVHDVAEMVDVVDVAQAICGRGDPR